MTKRLECQAICCGGHSFLGYALFSMVTELLSAVQQAGPVAAATVKDCVTYAPAPAGYAAIIA
jgi:hypothetical protein